MMLSHSITSEMLCGLRERVKRQTSPERFVHVLAVEETASDMAMLYCPERENQLRAAALLHDVTKELTTDGHLAIFEAHGIKPTKAMTSAPATLHAVTAALVIPEQYPEFAEDEIISAVRYHTTGRANMTLIEKIIYLADYIEPTRKYESCKRLRAMFFDAPIAKMSETERLRHLDAVILQSLEGTLEHLREKGGVIDPDTQSAKDHLAQKSNYN